MRRLILSALIILIATVSNYYTIAQKNNSIVEKSIPDWTITDTISDNGKPLPFRMWIPPAAKHVSGLILAAKVRAEEEFVINPAIRKVSAEENLAIIKSDSKAFAMFDITKGEDVFFLRILKKLAAKSGFSEIEFAPWLTFGHSTAGHFAKNLAYWKPERTFGILYFKSGQFHCPVWTKPGTSIKNIPILAINGQFEEYGPHGAHPAGESLQAQWLAVRDTFMLMRKTGHLVSLIVEPGAGHSAISQKDMDYMALFIKKAAQYKIPKNAIATDKPVILNDLKESMGVLSDTCIYKLISEPNLDHINIIKPFKEYPGKLRSISFWHFDNEMANAWIRFHQNKTRQNMKCQFILLFNKY
jgi:hypothetical protein